MDGHRVLDSLLDQWTQHLTRKRPANDKDESQGPRDSAAPGGVEPAAPDSGVDIFGQDTQVGDVEMLPTELVEPEEEVVEDLEDNLPLTLPLD